MIFFGKLFGGTGRSSSACYLSQSGKHASEEAGTILCQLKQLQFREKMCRAYRRISHTLSPLTQLGLNRIEVPDTLVLGNC
jgi:hypothetical protein